MTFIEWATDRNMSGMEYQFAQEAWNDAIFECAQIADARAMRCEEQVTDADEDERTSLRSLAWQFSVMAAEFVRDLARSNDGVQAAVQLSR